MIYRIGIALSGWLLLAAFLFIKFMEYGDGLIGHLFVFSQMNMAEVLFNSLIFLAPVLSTGLGVRMRKQGKLFARDMMPERTAPGNEKTYRELFENNPYPMWVFDLDSLMFLEVNDAAVDKYGYSKEEFLGMTIKDIRPSEEIPELIRVLKDKQDKNMPGVKHAGCWKHKKKDGTVFDVEITAHSIDYGGKRAYLVLIDDITDRKNAIEELRDSETKYRRLMECSQDAIFIADTQTGQIINANSAASKLIGRQIEEIIGMHHSALHPIEEIDRYREIFQRHIRDETAIEEDVFVVHKDGRKIPIEISGTVIELRGKKLIQGIFRNITNRKRIESALKESEEKFRNLAEQSPNMIFINKRGRVAYVNRKCEEVMGFTKDEFYSPEFNFISLVAPEYHEQVKDNFLRHMRGEEIPSFEYSLITKSGARLDGIHTTKLINYEGEQAILGIVTDITERKRAEEQLRMEKDRAQSYLDIAGTMIVVLDIDGRVALLNKKGCETLGYSESEAIGMDWFDNVIPEIGRDTLRGVFETLVTGKWEGYEKYENPVLTKTGEERIIAWNNAVIRGEDGSVIGTISSGNDVTERKQAEEQLASSEERLKVIFEYAPDAYYLSDLKGRFVDGNIAAERMFGLKRAEMIGNSFMSLNLMDSSEMMMAAKKLAINAAGKGTGPDEYNLRRNDGTTVAVEITTYPVKVGYQTLVLGIARDITERKRTDAAILESEKQYRALVDNAIVGIFKSNLQGDVLLVNDALVMMLGFDSPEDFMSQKVQSRYKRAEDRAAFIDKLKAIGKVDGFEAELLKKSGKTINALLSAVLDGEVLSGMVMDITKRKQAEEKARRQLEQQRALRAIDMAITSSLDLRLTLDVVLEQIRSRLKVDAADVLLLNQHTLMLEYASGRGFRTGEIKHTSIQLGEGLAGMAARQLQPLVIPELSEADPEFANSPLVRKENFKSYIGLPLTVKGQVKGFFEIFMRTGFSPDEEWLEFLEAIAGQAAIAIDNASLFKDLQLSRNELIKAYDSTIAGWSMALDYRDKETEGHSKRVMELTLRIAREMGMSASELVHVRRGALLHDIGKLGVPDNILLKPGKLTDEEWELMKQHPGIAYEILSPIEFLKPALHIPYCHHEKWDGTGYPRGLKGQQIPLEARIFAIVDVYDALRSDRPYRPAWSKEKALEYVRESSGNYFDPEVVEVFLKLGSLH